MGAPAPSWFGRTAARRRAHPDMPTGSRETWDEVQRLATALGVTLSVVIGSVTNERIVRDCFQRYRPKVVFHAAAHKHVPLMEGDNAWLALRNNTLGTYHAALAAAAPSIDPSPEPTTSCTSTSAGTVPDSSIQA